MAVARAKISSGLHPRQGLGLPLGEAMGSRVFERAAFLSGICVLAGIILLLISYSLGPEPAAKADLWPDLLRDLGIILASVGTISAVYELFIRRQLTEDLSQRLVALLDPDTRRLGISALYRSRDEKTLRGQSIDDLIKSTQKELLCAGLGLRSFVPERQALIRSRIKQGARFRFLIFDAESPTLETLDRSLGAGKGDLIAFVRNQTSSITNFRADLAAEGLAEGFEVRVYDAVPTFGLIEIDYGLATHRMIVEINGFRAEGAACPGFALLPNAEGWSGFFRERAGLLWDSAKPLA